eukprot:9805861-Alexandrium_andersonii.AAC.1
MSCCTQGASCRTLHKHACRIDGHPYHPFMLTLAVMPACRQRIKDPENRAVLPDRMDEAPLWGHR